MSESIVSALIAAVILIALALFVPCIESVAAVWTRLRSGRQGDPADQQPDQACRRDVA